MIKRSPSRHPIWRLVAANFYDFRLLLVDSWVALAGFALLLVLGTTYMLLGYTPEQNRPASVAEAAYQTMQLLVLQTSLAYPRDALGGVLFFVMPLLGLALVFQSVLNFGRLLLDKASRREQWQVALAATYRGHVIVCGLGRVGYRAVSALRETGYDVVVVERAWDTEFVEAVLALKVPVVIGDARQVRTLEQAGLARAKGVLAAIGDDLANIEIALEARRRRPEINVVLRIFDADLDSGMERDFGRNTVFSSSGLAAPTLAAAAVSRDIAHVLNCNGKLLGLTEQMVEQDSQLSGFVRAVEEKFDLLVLEHRRRGALLRPSPMEKLEGGDAVTILGSIDALEQARLANLAGSKLGFLAPRQLQRPTPTFNTVIICGLGRVGYRVLSQLAQLPRPPKMVVITLGAPSPFRADADRLGALVIDGDARADEVLQQAGLDHAYSVVAVTGSDLLNIQIGLAARRVRPNIHLVLRVFSDVLADQLASLFGIHTAYSTAELAAPTLAAASVLSDLSHAVRVGNRLLGQVQATIRPNDGLVGTTVAQARANRKTVVLALSRNGTSVPFNNDTILQLGDDAILLAPLQDETGKVTR